MLGARLVRQHAWRGGRSSALRMVGVRSLASDPLASANVGKGRVSESASPVVPDASKSSGIEEERSSFFEKYDWMLKMFGYYTQASKDIRTGVSLFRTAEEQGRLLCTDESYGLNFDWYDSKKNFMARQQVLMLHVWMVHKRLLMVQDDSRGKELQENMFDTFWDNTTRRIRATGVHELTVNKHLAQVQKICFTAACSYDHGLAIEDDDKNSKLGSYLWHNVFQRDPKTPDECVYKMIDYVRDQIDALKLLKDEDLYDAKINWLDLQGVEATSGEWRQALAANGKTYYWNVKTRESRWTDPSKDEP